MFFVLTASNAVKSVSYAQVTLSVSDWIQLIGILASSIIGTAGIVISVHTLRQNNKMIEESTRPNIQIYPVYANSILYIVIKNFGSSEAIIDEIICNHVFTKAESFTDPEKEIFNLSGAIFSPGYSLKCPLISHAVSNETYEFRVKYHSAQKKYSAAFSFNPYKNAPFADTYPSGETSEDHLRNISKDMHNIFKNTL